MAAGRSGFFLEQFHSSDFHISGDRNVQLMEFCLPLLLAKSVKYIDLNGYCDLVRNLHIKRKPIPLPVAKSQPRWGNTAEKRDEGGGHMRRTLGVVVVLVLLGVVGSAQTFRGAINGTVTDASGAVVAGASVKATNTGTGVTLATVSTSDGQF